MGRSWGRPAKWTGKGSVCLGYMVGQVGSKNDFLFPSGRMEKQNSCNVKIWDMWKPCGRREWPGCGVGRRVFYQCAMYPAAVPPYLVPFPGHVWKGQMFGRDNKVFFSVSSPWGFKMTAIHLWVSCCYSRFIYSNTSGNKRVSNFTEVSLPGNWSWLLYALTWVVVDGSSLKMYYGLLCFLE